MHNFEAFGNNLEKIFKRGMLTASGGKDFRPVSSKQFEQPVSQREMDDFLRKISDFFSSRRVFIRRAAGAAAFLAAFAILVMNVAGKRGESTLLGDVPPGDSSRGSSFFAEVGSIVAKTFRNAFGPEEKGTLLAEVPLDRSIDSLVSDASASGTGAPRAAESAGGEGAPALHPEPERKQKNAEKAPAASSSSPIPAAASVPSAPPPADSATPPPVCGFESAKTSGRTVIINEIAWMGSPTRSGENSSAAAANEWIELKNSSPSAVRLGGWRLLDRSGDIAVSFGEGDSVPAGGMFLLERTDDDSVPSVPADKIYSGNLPNSGSWLKLLDQSCGVVDELDASAGWVAFGGSNDTKQTLERDRSDSGWHTSADAGGTPKKENSEPPRPSPPASTTTAAPLPKTFLLSVSKTGDGSGTVESDPAGIFCGSDCSDSYNEGTFVTLTALPSSGSSFSGWSGACTGVGICTIQISAAVSAAAAFVSNPPSPPPAGAGHPVIAEIQITGGTGKADSDFIKIANPAGQSVDIAGWKLRKRTQSGTESSARVFPDGSTIAANGTFLWANSADGFSASVSANVSSTQTLTDNSSIALFDTSGTVVDALAWGSGHVNPFVEGSAFPDNPGASQVLRRKVVNGIIQDTKNNADDFSF